MTTLQMLSTTDVENLIRDHSPAKSTLQSIIIEGLKYELKEREQYGVVSEIVSPVLSKEDSALIDAIENI